MHMCSRVAVCVRTLFEKRAYDLAMNECVPGRGNTMGKSGDARSSFTTGIDSQLDIVLTRRRCDRERVPLRKRQLGEIDEHVLPDLVTLHHSIQRILWESHLYSHTQE